MELSFPDPPPADDVVLLRAWEASDIPENVMGFADPTVLRFSWPRETPYAEQDAREFFADQTRSRRAGDELNFAFVEPGSPQLVVGGGSVYGIDLGESRAAVGFWLSPAARGRGIATHATRLMARWAFDGLGVARLELTCAPDNDASQRFALRCGFVGEGRLRAHTPFQGKRRDSLMFSLLAGELDGG